MGWLIVVTTFFHKSNFLILLQIPYHFSVSERHKIASFTALISVPAAPLASDSRSRRQALVLSAWTSIQSLRRG